MDNRNTYSMPAPWGGIILWEENGELARICPTIDSIQEPSPAPIAVADVMQQLEAVLCVPQATSEQLRETLFGTKAFRKLPEFTRRVLDIVSRIEPGQWMSYSQVAQTAGNPAAARAVGQALAHNPFPILIGCAAGSATSMGSVYLLCRLFGLEESLTVSLLPKSVTTPIAVSIAEPAGGMVPITVVAVIFTGILGGIFAPLLIRLFRVADPVAAGLAIGASSHAVGTSKAIELGEIEGAMSGLAIGICGIITVLFSMLVL